MELIQASCNFLEPQETELVGDTDSEVISTKALVN